VSEYQVINSSGIEASTPSLRESQHIAAALLIPLSTDFEPARHGLENQRTWRPTLRASLSVFGKNLRHILPDVNEMAGHAQAWRLTRESPDFSARAGLNVSFEPHNASRSIAQDRSSQSPFCTRIFLSPGFCSSNSFRFANSPAFEN
jgi:hypothetical protein